MKRIYIVAATLAALGVIGGGTLYVSAGDAQSKPAAAAAP